MKILLNCITFLLLTILTQVGGIIYLFSIMLIKGNGKRNKFKKATIFITLYSVFTFLIIPFISPQFGREIIADSSILQAKSLFYKIANRNYVTSELNSFLSRVSADLAKENKGIKLIYLDANFPFFDKFPLLPHLSHNDGKKIDVAFIYRDEFDKLVNSKPSKNGYGVYESPTSIEINQTKECINKGYYQYDFSKYLTFGKINHSITFSDKATKELIEIILKNKIVEKLFIEPHLKQRLKLKNSKIRFHGCQAVRHDDHIHFQIR